MCARSNGLIGFVLMAHKFKDGIMRTIIFFVFFFVCFNQARCQTTQPSLTLGQCVALPCEITVGDISAMTMEVLLRNYFRVTEERSECTQTLRISAVKNEPAFKKLICLKAEQRALSCGIVTSPQDKLREFIQAGISPSRVSLDLLVDLYAGGNKAVVCTSLSGLRKKYTQWVRAEFDACTNTGAGCEKLCAGLQKLIPTEWSISQSDVKDFSWPRIGLDVHTLGGEVHPSPSLMCTSLGKSFSLSQTP